MVQWRYLLSTGCLLLSVHQIAAADSYYLSPCNPGHVYNLPFTCLLEGTEHSMLQIDTSRIAKGNINCKFTYQGLPGHPNPSVVILSRNGDHCSEVVSKTIPVLTAPWPPHPTQEVIKACSDQGQYGDYMRFLLQAGTGFLPVQVACE